MNNNASLSLPLNPSDAVLFARSLIARFTIQTTRYAPIASVALLVIEARREMGRYAAKWAERSARSPATALPARNATARTDTPRLQKLAAPNIWPQRSCSK